MSFKFFLKSDMLKRFSLHVLLVAIFLSSFINFYQLLILSITLYLATGGWRFAKILTHTTKRDVIGLMRFLKTKYLLYNVQRKNLSVPKIFLQNVKKHPDRVALKFEGNEWTFAKLNEYSNRVANLMIEYGFQPGEEVSLLMDNRIEYIGIWLGLSKAGLVTAFLNTSQRTKSLIHSISVVNCKAVIFDEANQNSILEIKDDLDKLSMQYFYLGDGEPKVKNAKPLARLMTDSPSTEPHTLKNTSCSDRLFYIYTSGTTGLPKAAIIKNHRYIWMGGALRNLVDLGNNKYQNDLGLDNNNIYTCLPLYHLAGGVLGTCQVLIFGDTMTIAKRFSASNFWKDCIKYKCTASQYIGEICRYLLAQPVTREEKEHHVTIIFGNGLRPKIWKEFVTRFNIKQVGEFYGSTEGNANIINTDNKEGSCGFMSLIIPSIYPVCLIKLNEETNEPLRDENGMCLHCTANESGEFVGKITKDVTRSFDGYVNKDATNKKIIRDVFSKGDQAFLSGDLLTMDEYGYLYFKDRTGDTFRWKGENVSTAEVESVISNILNQRDCVVFGIEIKDTEGRAGMAAIQGKEDSVDLDYLLERMQKMMSRFAIPMFIRLCDNFEITGTFKMPKIRLQKEGYDFYKIKDPLYFLDVTKKKFVRINEQVYQDIINGNIKV